MNTSLFGRGVRVLREKRGVTQAEAAQLAGISQATWSRIETGESQTTRQRQKILDALAAIEPGQGTLFEN